MNLEKIYPSSDTGTQAIGKLERNQNLLNQGMTSVENQINVLNSHIAKLGVTQVRASNGGDANELKETDKIFIFNYVNIPSGTDYGLLEIYNLESAEFSPSPDAVVVQRFTSWWTGYIYTRVYRKQGDTYVWNDWNSPDEKIAALQTQLTAISNMLMETASIKE